MMLASSSLPVTPKTNLRHEHSTFLHADSLKQRGQSSDSSRWTLPQSKGSHCRRLLLVSLFLIPGVAFAAQPIHYLVDLRAPDTHMVQVTLNIPGASAETEIQIPTWNCLYQIRDFVKDVEDLKGDCDGQRAELDRRGCEHLARAGPVLRRPHLPLLGVCQHRRPV